MNSKKTYAALAIMLATSLSLMVLPTSQVTRMLADIPFIGSLCGAVFVLLRDNIAYERSQATAQNEHGFVMGATSHMANVAFDKHALFCEEYVSEMFKTLTTLFREGPTKQVLPHASLLSEIRIKNAVWLTPEIEKALDSFEVAIRRIGTNDRVVTSYPGQQGHDVLVKEMFSLYAEVVGEKEWEGEPLTGERAVATIIEQLRKVLGIAELTQLRTEFVKRALTNLKDGGPVS